MNNVDFNIENELKKLPKKPGVYLMHKKDGEVIYVGKAKNLSNRVKQYFQKSRERTAKIEQMISNINYFEYIVVDSELESLILESNLIKEYRPKYNTLLKDDKNYPYIKLTTTEAFPRVFMVHRKGKDNAKYFGPYISYGLVNSALEFIKENYKLRLCNIMPKKSCLYAHLGLCLAPCVNKCTIKYKKEVNEVKKLLSGDIDALIDKLTKTMLKYSKKSEFELAAEIRDKINTINEITERQKIDSKTEIDKDILGLYKGKDVALIQIFEVRDGNIVDRNTNILNIDNKDTDSEIIESFIKQYYNETYFLPKEIWLPTEIDEKDLYDKWLSRDEKKCKLFVPKKGEKDKLVKLASLNAKIQYEQKVAKYIREERDIGIAFDYLKQMTGLKEINRLESYDISNTAGVLSVASMVVWENKGFKKNDYRKFRIKTVSGPDDYKSLQEVITRRVERYINKDIKFGALPSIFLIDGGFGQVSAVEKILAKYMLNIPVMGMVKDASHRTRGIAYQGKIIDLKGAKELFKLITKIQDETHRFAIEYHKSLRSKEMLCSQEKKQRK